MSELPVFDQVLVVVVFLAVFATVAWLVGYLIREWLRFRRSHLEHRYRDEQRKIEHHRLDQVMRAGLFGSWREVDNREEYIKKRMECDDIESFTTRGNIRPKVTGSNPLPPPGQRPPAPKAPPKR